ncbi:MAG: zinc metalloprotease HtpX [Candidatus Doudnabacteria bacterium RIFCSPLOWO2_02_FULL_49_13]|uniref:Protease HtpX homolog n=1 Tax=Candidatus Doudnabacteria bacterium RIFCSPHIGHO2_12_FULL_48_16 TaxID=1817838 RepID=A0A1F5PL84_9BACT|nr:MAG: zinc metalloprotease HtpX [Candidatus Doudnabacteria bacterium RIFCSPHIGHO2_02_FULL_49_24]OGE88780.1 MAG: zinc metalloprotease HtpX [Candidatus Doudnabacteria bacterium RIFCSPHIGHO2_01_FULL_50_67]OGE90698.1 MAG: zinc metalloprotease HtpX [Candidatus Doudnabacteria bacterium RIFCSPHIGHO2_12_FULL_48_16]OGE97765.1 MAG: zinc metalloprotease HtpX [Candidatus Doudnabacteria bacterium RIFCSPLOWO2_01_FULL_49_40]OGF02562.1 MAG: zinc metalloprotease HtpX [Candidatus Doudnabacteria bacterium RIFCS
MVYTEISSNKRKTVLLITFFLVLIIGLGFVFSKNLDMPQLLPLAVGLSVLMSLTSYFYSDKIVLAMSKAREVKRADDPELYRTVENLAITAGLPTPKVYLIEDTALNAFATGRNPHHAVLCVTTGLRSQLTKQELEGVMAHELSHIGNYDIRLSTIIVVLVGIITLLSDWMLRISFWGGRKRSNDHNQATAVFAIIGLILAILSPLAATLIQLAISRKREYLADASGVLLTRYPQGLAGALRKIAADREPLEVANKATAHLYIANPFKAQKIASLFNTHPPIEDRIKRLEAMS